MDCGFLYICADDQYLAEARKSVKSLKSVMPEAEVAIITNADSLGKVFDQIINLPNPEYGYEDKVWNFHRTPFDKTVFLDSDTYITEPIDDLFDVLDRFDMAVARAPSRNPFTPDSSLPPSMPEYNTGVIAYRESMATTELFERLRELYKSTLEEGIDADQAAFREVAFKSTASIHTLPPEYNCRTVNTGYLNGDAKIIHGRHNRTFEEIEDKLNKHSTRRIFAAIESDIGVFSPVDATVFDWLWFSLACNGFRDTARIVWSEFVT